MLGALADLLVGGGADVDAQWLTSGFELVGQSDVVAEEAVARHHLAHHTRQNWSRVNSDAHLSTECTYINITDLSPFLPSSFFVFRFPVFSLMHAPFICKTDISAFNQFQRWFEYMYE